MDPIKSARDVFSRLYGRPPSNSELCDTLIAFTTFACLDYGGLSVDRFQERVRRMIEPGALQSFGASVVRSAHYPWYE